MAADVPPSHPPLLPSPQPAQWGPLDPFEYHPQRGLYFHEVAPGLICGTQPRSGHDVAVLAECGVTHILNLQVCVWGGRPYQFRGCAGVHACSKSHGVPQTNPFPPPALRLTRTCSIGASM